MIRAQPVVCTSLERIDEPKLRWLSARVVQKAESRNESDADQVNAWRYRELQDVAVGDGFD